MRSKVAVVVQLAFLWLVAQFMSLCVNFLCQLLVFCMQINGSLARRAIKELMAKGTIRLVAAHSNQQIYTRATNT
jgi:hypothetical protein